MNCIYCKKEIPDNSKWCDFCGASQSIVQHNSADADSKVTSFSTSDSIAKFAKPTKKKKIAVIIISIIVAFLLISLALYTLSYINLCNKYNTNILNVKLQTINLANYSKTNGTKLKGFGYSIMVKGHYHLKTFSKMGIKIYTKAKGSRILMQKGNKYGDISTDLGKSMTKMTSLFKEKCNVKINSAFDFDCMYEKATKSDFAFLNIGKNKTTAALLTIKNIMTPICTKMFLLKNNKVSGILFYSKESSSFKFIKNSDLNTSYYISFFKSGTLDSILNDISTMRFN